MLGRVVGLGIGVAALSFGALAFGLGPALAVPVTYSVDLDPGHLLFGNLNQRDIPGCGPVACGLAAAVNSFVYLQHRYPKVYDKKLVADDNPQDGFTNYQEQVDTASALAPAAYMNIGAGGTYWDDFIFGKRKWIEERVPNRTRYGAQAEAGWGSQHTLQDDRKKKPGFVKDNTVPTWQFLFDNLTSGEDVEILMEGGPSHYVTLVSLLWTDTDMDGIVDDAEDALLGFVDPEGGLRGQAEFRQAGLNQPLFLDYNADNSYSARITTAVSESPLPEPASLALFALGLAALVYGKGRLAGATGRPL